MSNKGIIIIYTGDGKGKTTAAFGQAIRAAGHGLHVCIVQFIKGKWPTGEAAAIKNLPDNIELHIKGTGFTWQAGDLEEVRKAALNGWNLACTKLNSMRYDMLVLDELTYLVSHGILDEEMVIKTLANRPAHVHVVITGRGATSRLIEAADLVTEMKLIKHPYKSGVKARKGIEF